MKRTRFVAKDWRKNPLEINENELDYEWARQAKLFKRWADKTALARSRVNEFKGELDLTEAELRLRANKNPKAFGLDKTTEKMLDAAVINHSDYRKALRHLNRAKYELDHNQAMVDGLDHKKRALEKYVDLHLASYFAEPRRRQTSEVMKRKARQIGG